MTAGRPALSSSLEGSDISFLMVYTRVSQTVERGLLPGGTRTNLETDTNNYKI